MIDKRIATVAAIAACFCMSQAYAHHSYAQFDHCQPVTLEGEVNYVEWINPHIVISLRTNDVPSYRVEWMALLQLERAGIAVETLKAGDHVVITGRAWRDPALKLLSLLSEVRRPSDGWTWTRERPIPDCRTRVPRGTRNATRSRRSGVPATCRRRRRCIANSMSSNTSTSWRGCIACPRRAAAPPSIQHRRAADSAMSAAS